MLEFFAENAWAPLTMSMDKRIGKYCADRYQSVSGVMTEVWNRFMPIVKLMSWSMENNRRKLGDYFIDIFKPPLWEEKDPSAFDGILDSASENAGNAVYILETLASLENEIAEDSFLRRDAFDIARTICGRYLNLGITLIQKLVCQWRNGTDTAEAVFKACGGCIGLMELLAELLSEHEDYSLYESLCALEHVHKVNPVFEKTLKNNASNNYCRSYIYENARFLYLPEMKLMFDFLKRNINEGNRENLLYMDEYVKKAQKNKELYDGTPLSEMAYRTSRPVVGILRDISREIGQKKVGGIRYGKRFNENSTVKTKLQKAFLCIFSYFDGVYNITAESGSICVR